MKFLKTISTLYTLLSIIVFCFLSLTCQGQATTSEIKSSAPTNYKLDFLKSTTGIPSVSSSCFTHKSDMFNYAQVYENSLGIFCKAENKASKKAAIQMRCRLGSLSYVNKLEGKYSKVR